MSCFFAFLLGVIASLNDKLPVIAINVLIALRPMLEKVLISSVIIMLGF